MTDASGSLTDIADCPLCDPKSGIVARTDHWILILNENQATLGRVYFALTRHETDITRLTPDEQRTLWEFVGRTKDALVRLFAPDHHNYLFHMNLTPHVHFHIYPRYATPRQFAGQTFTDTRYGDHYDPAESHALNHASYEALLTAIRAELGGG